MPIILAVIAAVTGVLFFIMRARNAADAANELFDMANDVRLAARRFGFQRNTNVHPAENIEDPNIAITGIASAFLELEALPTSEQREALAWELSKTLNISKDDADELCILGRWLVSECGGAGAAVTRLSRKLFRLDPQKFAPLLQVINGVLAQSGSDGLNTRQTEALDDVKRAFKIR
ncbi:hypothetical protein KO498_13440 [Lentibacter algarum]|uniref:hypothetical protein n=1 Tax=Lentibacter algarum TaxID=576131 RepID=UPI001C081A12|nr:hypothetical protein [Lentibacter algarum]MBU2982815.1 hypothetical protein [Lentibacter algarum]